MKCPDAGAWRAWLDGEAAAPADTPAAMADHAAGCDRCRDLVAALRRDAGFAAGAIALLAPAATVPTITRVPGIATPVVAKGSIIASSKESHPMSLSKRLSRWRVAAGGLAAALAVAFAFATPTGQTAAAQFLAQFRAQRLTVVTIDPRQMDDPLTQLAALGTVSGAPLRLNMTHVGSAADASQSVGFAVLTPDPASLPSNVGATPARLVRPGSQVRFTLNRAKARVYFDTRGRSDVAIPERYDGASLVVNIPATALTQYGGAQGALVVVGQAGELTAQAEGGASLEELRQLVLQMPGITQETRNQLQAIQDWRTTLPIPVPVEQVRWRETTVAGGPGLLFNDNSGAMSAVIWQRNGAVFGVGGTIDAATARTIASGLR